MPRKVDRSADIAAETARGVTERAPSAGVDPHHLEVVSPFLTASELTRDHAADGVPLPHSDLEFQEFAEHCPFGMAIVESETHIVRYANAAFHRLSRIGRTAIVGQAIDLVFPGPIATRVDALLRRARATGQPQSEIDIDDAADREPTAWRVTVWNAPDCDSVDECCVLQISDVTAKERERRHATEIAEQLREVNEQLRAVNEQLLFASLREQDLREEAEAANRAKSVFLATMSHELRTPLTAIMGYESLLEDGITGPVSETQRSQLTRIKKSASHLLTLIDEVLSLARIEAGRAVVRREPVDIGALCAAAVELVTPLVAAKRLTFTVEPLKQPLTLQTDPVKVDQILVNLLGNAVKFTDRGDVTFRLRLEVDKVIFEVVDTGKGIAPDNLERVFEAFWQVQQKPTRRIGGSGLGLNVSRHLARLLGGDVTVQSTLGRGSTFALSLPLPVAVGLGDPSEGARVAMPNASSSTTL